MIYLVFVSVAAIHANVYVDTLFPDVLVWSNTKGWGSMLFARQLTYCVEIIDQEGITNVPTATSEEQLSTHL